jgi:FkbM family methyltransferase
MFYKLVNTYSRHFPFPRRGLKYFISLMKHTGIYGKTFHKKMPGNFYMYLNPQEHIQQQLFWYGSYESEIGELLTRIIKAGDVFLDVGANIGYFSLLVAKTEPAAKVFAFEPSSHAFEKLEKHIKDNDLKNIVAINAAVGENDETGILFLADADNEGMSSLKEPENYSGKKQEIKIISPDNWFIRSGLEIISIIKIDVEGSELAALKGMKNIIAEFHPLIVTEINPQTLSLFGLKKEDIFRFIYGFRYEIYCIEKGGGIRKYVKSEEDKVENVLFIDQDKILNYPTLFKK